MSDSTATTTARPKRSWGRPPSRPPAVPIKPDPPTGVGPVIEVRRSSDLKNMRSGATYQWMGGFQMRREQLHMNGLNGVTLVDPWIEEALEANIYARNFNMLTLIGGNLSRSRTKSGILTDEDCQGLRMFGVRGDGNEEHFIYYGSHVKNGKPFIIEDCVGKGNHRCMFQCNLEGKNFWVVGGHILRCTADGNATEQGSQFNLGAWDRGLFGQNHVINGKDDGVILCGIDGKASKNCRIEGSTFKNNRDAPLKTADGSSGHVVSKCVFDEMPVMTGIRSDKTNLCNGKKF
jgi:hypothetical protein